MANGALGVAGGDVLHQRRGKQARGVQRLQQVVAGGGQEAGFRSVGVFSELFGLAQCLLRFGTHAVLLA